MRWSAARVCLVLTLAFATARTHAQSHGPLLPDDSLSVSSSAPTPQAHAPGGEVAGASASSARVPLIEHRGLGKPIKAPGLLVGKPAPESAQAGRIASTILEPGSWQRTGISLLVVLGLIVLSMRLVRRFSLRQGIAGALGVGGKAPSGVLEVLARYPIARGQNLVLLRLDRRVMLCCHTRGGKLGAGGGMTLLTELTEPEDVASILVKTRDASSESMARRFQSLLSRSESDADRVLAAGSSLGSQTSVTRSLNVDAPRLLPKGEAGRVAAYGLDRPVPARGLQGQTGADAADAIRRRLAAMRTQGVTA